MAISRIDIPATFTKFQPALDHVRQLTARGLGKDEAILLIVRDGATFFNEAVRLQAWKPDLDRLNDIGIAQAQLLGRAIRQFPKIDFVASSDVERTRQTVRLALGQIVQPPVMPKISITPMFLETLRDFDYGDLHGIATKKLTGQSFCEFQRKFMKLFDVWQNDRWNFQAPGGENYQGFARRVVTGFDEEILPQALGKVSLLVTHVSWIRELLLQKVLLKTIKDYMPNGAAAASLTIVHLRLDATWELLLNNNTEHLN